MTDEATGLDRKRKSPRINEDAQASDDVDGGYLMPSFSMSCLKFP